MARRLLGLAAALIVTACGSGTGGLPEASHSEPARSTTPAGEITPPQSPATAQTYAVFVRGFLTGPHGYRVVLVRQDGSIAVAVNALNRTYSQGLVDLPAVSTSQSRVYYLDGDSVVRYLRPDGSGGEAYRLPVGANELGTFAVSPDDRRIAVTVIDYSTNPPRMRLFDDELAGHHVVELFSSNSVYVWPVGWHRGRLVLAVSPVAFVQNAGSWFMGSRGFHVVEADSAIRLVTICEQVDASTEYPTSPWGGTCNVYPTRYSVVSWEGQERPVLPNDRCRATGIPSPDGTVVAVLGSNRVCNGAYNDPIRIVAANGAVRTSAAVGNPLGWLDGDHLAYMKDLPAFSPPSAIAPIGIVDLSTNLTSQVDPQVSAPGEGAFFAGVVPGGLG